MLKHSNAAKRCRFGRWWSSAFSMVTVDWLCSDCLMSPWSPSLCFSLFSLSLLLCPPACIHDMRRAAVLQGSKVINALQMCLWAMKDWGIFPTSVLSASLLFFSSLVPYVSTHLFIFSRASLIPSSFVFSPLTSVLFLTPPFAPCFIISLCRLSIPLFLPNFSSCRLSASHSLLLCGSSRIIKHVRVVLTWHNWHPSWRRVKGRNGDRTRERSGERVFQAVSFLQSGQCITTAPLCAGSGCTCVYLREMQSRYMAAKVHRALTLSVYCWHGNLRTRGSVT